MPVRLPAKPAVRRKAMYLSEMPPVMQAACKTCGLRWRADRDRQVDRVGDITTVEALARITRACPRKARREQCGAGWIAG